MRACVLTVLLGLWASDVLAQGVLSDIMSGKLTNPEVGVFAWYELTDAATEQRLFMRQAIVGSKRVSGTTGYYLETEVMPEIGFPIIYKLLLTGPATDPGNVHEIVVKDGIQPVETLPTDLLEISSEDGPQEQRESLGMVTLSTPAGDIESEHFVIIKGDNRTELWVNDAVRPMGIVKMVSDDGELILSRYGTGGPDAESALERQPHMPAPDDVKVRITPGPTKNFTGRSSAE